MAVTLPQITSALSIFIAAVLVRLARGMPTLDWKSVPLEKRKMLTGELVDVSREYAGLLALLMLLLLLTVSIGAISMWFAPENTVWRKGMSALIGMLVSLSVLRFGYVVWRDLDIVSLQKTVIDGMADQELASKNSETATAKIEQMRMAKLSGGEKHPIEVLQDGETRT
ncbi:hypothetical protein ACTTAF_06630 [Rhodobacter capsulatus]|uniref:hypothetical protein n=1 Tax=Rhodobacter capsulatus TaxID=1061 RepID=UPI00103B1DCD|nr:hypothetical protein [Rhodobacter capsulatus]